MSTYRGYYKSILSDDWGLPSMSSTDKDEVLEWAFFMFDQEGQYTIVTKDDTPYFIDYGGNIERYKDYPDAVAKYFEGRMEG